MATERPDPTNSKVGRLIETYEFNGFGDELEARWTADEDADSLRTLARAFNLELLQHATDDAGLDLLDGEVESLYDALTGDDATGAERTRARGRLERAGLDVEQLQKNFVSHQAIHTYLTSYRGASKERRQSDPTERVQRLRGRLVAVTESALDSLEHREKLEIGTPDVLVDIQVLCTECGRQYGFDELIEQGSCACADTA
ncbi:rod-determining factor RdfA [Haloferax namakaokahaiae]|uniref:Rod-determining factor RdfA n=1 Tax=Haloferax namakaokahaiae TaxID=1748331 RepID=A0ABD5ZJH9_9EURY